MAQLVYIDETISNGEDRLPKYLTVVGVAVEEDSVRALAERMRAVVHHHLGWLPHDFEFHANELWGGGGYWKGKSPTELLAVFDDVIKVLLDLDIFVVHATIDIPALHQKYLGHFDDNAYLLALQFMLEKLDSYRAGQPLRILIADQTQEHQLRATDMVGEMQWRPLGGEVPGRLLSTVIDSIHFVDSKSSPGVQLADCVAYIIHRNRRTAYEHPAAKAAVQRLSAEIDSKTRTWRAAWP
ncbi:DUF3800 domain-containing protein [Leifsonia sp. 1010]|uniref:DUF3800 domain-containing protein n=1 Tax=Leifsonia sp. 1010 TaxID=2817769 RepID=UPI0028627FB4|nr:DUF3800 domain-containing protein [Leifsonia sp. 1010]MDR6611235.1 hypothetical protein [Leifsonia sp. 1010]